MNLSNMIRDASEESRLRNTVIFSPQEVDDNLTMFLLEFMEKRS